ncbi:lipopolysaccharide-induced tumor necrosis factor-alpha factor homolog [Thunnus albacares]|uniref:lipopolysaccharide-induced tumor necrosis factor-alpha factor homolog n=1 Tax=Thunnus albacares TaxID=8236 RepID=UPI001CF65BB9|nr:lipopolysaccharide-induced tumor necrosis factor-alpha factor homolog [Thunnus albacares]
MTSSDSEMNRISTEMKHLSLKRQQLLERRKILCIFQELRSRAEFGQTVTLQPCSNHLLSSSLGVNFAQSEKDEKVELEFNAPGSNIFYVVAPPSVPAPQVILDVENLPPCPCKTQCPECQQFITTEIDHSISSVTWLVCFMTALIGCVAGCCLIPFCLKRFKSITHKCPNCRSSITTIKKL